MPNTEQSALEALGNQLQQESFKVLVRLHPPIEKAPSACRDAIQEAIRAATPSIVIHLPLHSERWMAEPSYVSGALKLARIGLSAYKLNRQLS